MLRNTDGYSQLITPLLMAFYEVYSHPALIRYKTSVCTKATLFLVVVLCLTYIPPLLIAYRSQGNVAAL